MNHELPDVQAGFRKGRATREQIANIHGIIEKARVFNKNIYSALLTMSKPLTVDDSKLWNRPPDLPPEKSACRSRSNG